jgi:hypothetical protein
VRLGALPVALIVAMSCSVAAAESVIWETRSIGPKGRVPISKGVKTYSPTKDIVVQKSPSERDGTPSWVKSLALDDTFGVGASVHREQPLTGFGLMVFRRGGRDDFSWEWFDQVSGSRFERRQGDGRVAVKVKIQGKGEELTSIEFLDDVTLRYLDDMSKLPGTVTHEVVIKKGSILTLTP